jgi:pantoate--beta-alanine ligase
MRLARQHADIIITTIFVNPAQFGPNEDFTRYPRDIEHDTTLAASAGTDILFLPSTEEMYPAGYVTYINVENITTVLEGKFRPTHFRGVATIVAKLFNITKPYVALFGQKDAQQVAVIKQMAKDLNFDLNIIVGPIVREPDGLAMSSRNVYLSETERKEALVLSASLRMAEQMLANNERNMAVIIAEMKKMISSKPSADIDYISLADNATLQEVSVVSSPANILISLAVKFGKTRLIDNVVVTV